MRTYKQWLDYQELELVSTQQPEPERIRVLSVLKGIANSLIAALSASQLHIWQTTDRYGYIWWHVYDPITRQSVQLPSEREVRVWLDQSCFRRRVTTPKLRSYW